MNELPKEVKDRLISTNIKAKLIYMLKTTINLFEKNNIKYWAEGGTLLGAIRHKNFIPWDDDVDIGVLDSDNLEGVLKKLPSGLKYVPTFFGYKVCLRTGGKKLYKRGHLQKFTYPGLDIFIREIEGNKLKFKLPKAAEVWEKEHVSPDIFFPLKTYKFGSLNIKGANKAEQYLDKLYGKKWKTTGVISFNHSTERWLKKPIIFKLPK
tara:strand:+ start:580 stop:1203 length:624 start_codon:yes stop_codon:yes gene_type:complete